MRTVFAEHLHTEYVEPEPEELADGTKPVRQAFPLPASLSLRAPASTGTKRELSLLYRGGSVLARTPTSSGSMHSLASVLAGLAATPPEGSSMPTPSTPALDGAPETAAASVGIDVDYRVFVRGDDAVLVNWMQPAFVDDRWLANRGISEVPGWRARIDLTSGEIVTSPRLAGLRWSDAALQEPANVRERYRWVGLVTPTIRDGHDHARTEHDGADHDGADHDGADHDGADLDHRPAGGAGVLDDAATVALLIGHVDEHRQAWLDTVESLLASSRVAVVSESRTARRAIAGLLDRTS